jgi:amidase
MSEINRRGVAAAAVSLLAAGTASAQPKPLLPRLPKLGKLPSISARPPPAPANPWPDATATAHLIRMGQLTAGEATRTAIARAQAIQPALNFMVTSDFDRALTAAQAPAAGPFGGVPTLIKDLEDDLGMPTRMGSAVHLRSPPATQEGPAAAAFARMGLISIGKSATPEWGFLPTTEPLAFGPTRNPWNTAHSSGGSSGGAAAAVAAGVVPLAHASDGGGSIRIPASCCGVFGLKPSRGRMLGSSRENKVTDLSVDHVVTRTIRDSAAVFAAAEDPNTDAMFPRVGFVAGASKRRLNIGLIFEGVSGRPADPDVRFATERSVELLQSLGHRVIPTRWPVGPSFIEDFLLLWAAGAAEVAGALSKAAPGAERMLEPFTLGLAQMFGRAEEGAMDAAVERLNVASMAYDPWFAASGFDVVMSPVLGMSPPPIGFLSPTVPMRTLIERLIAYVGYTPLHNVAGAPAMSVPLNWGTTGLPIGTQFAARPGHERVLFELAYELEQAQPWAHKLPPVHV